MYLSRVLVDVDVNDSSVFVTLLYDIMLDIHLPTRNHLTETQRLFVKVMEGSFNGGISRMLRHRIPLKDCSNVEDPLNSTGDRVLHSQDLSF